jgi:REP element-mobilizing transposase RayT
MEPRTERKFFLPRLPREYYQGDAVVHWTLPIAHREQGWLTDSFHSAFREIVLHAASRERLLCPVYCLMPDHLHFIWVGLARTTDQLRAMAFLRTHLKPALAPYDFQHQSHDHVLKPDERARGAFAKTCFYILANPVRAELVQEPAEWRFSGTVIPGYPKLDPLDETFWPIFWKTLTATRDSDAGQIIRPPIQ